MLIGNEVPVDCSRLLHHLRPYVLKAHFVYRRKGRIHSPFPKGFRIKESYFVLHPPYVTQSHVLDIYNYIYV